MHRTIEASIQPAITDGIVKELQLHPYVVGLNVMRQASCKPPGDSLTVHVLNKGADDVLRIICRHTANTHFSIVTSEVASINDPQNQQEIDQDVDEAIWEEMETGLRHNGRLTTNYLLLMAIGGIISAIGFVSEVQTQVIAFVAASIIAPGLEPIVKIPLGIVLKRRNVLWAGVRASLAGYGVVVVSAAVTFFLLLHFDEVQASDFLTHASSAGLLTIKFKDVILSLTAAAASIIMYLSYRRNVIAGPLIALILISATAGIGMSAIIGEWGCVIVFLKRLAVDFALIIGVGLLLIFSKQKLLHKREPLR